MAGAPAGVKPNGRTRSHGASGSGRSIARKAAIGDRHRADVDGGDVAERLGPARLRDAARGSNGWGPPTTSMREAPRMTRCTRYVAVGTGESPR